MLTTSRRECCGICISHLGYIAAYTISTMSDEYYYDSEDAFNFYKHVWGGHFIHVGLYQDLPRQLTGTERIFSASSMALDHLLSKHEKHSSQPLDNSSRIMDMGAALGGAARHCAKKYGCRVTCIDLSAKENAANRLESAQQGLGDLIYIPGEKDFSHTGEESGTYDFIFSEDCFLHVPGPARESVMAEAARLLKPNGLMVFSDIMQIDNADTEKLAPVYQRLNLVDLGSPGRYKEWGAKHGLSLLEYDDRTSDLCTHYGTVKDVLLAKMPELRGLVSERYIQDMLRGLDSWVQHSSGENANICWGFQVFRKD